MTDTQPPSTPTPQKKDQRALYLFVFPLISCMLAAVVGVVLGQVGNLFYAVVGDSAACLSLPGFCGLFLITFGISFLTNRFLRKRLDGSSAQ